MSSVDIGVAQVRGTMANARGRWSSRVAFILAAAGSAVGLGSIWKFPYITGVNGGGWFVIIYLGCIVLVAAPIMIAEILIGRSAQRSPVGAFRSLSRRPGWAMIGHLGIGAGFLILSYYFVVAGWTLHYAWLAVNGTLAQAGGAAQYKALFAAVHADPALNVFWQLVFIALTCAVVMGGVQRGIERCCRLLFPLLMIVMLALMSRAVQSEGFAGAMGFIFGLHGGDLSAGGVLEALGHSFFTLSLGMGAMITYGSYLSRRDDVVVATAAVAGLDTLVSLLACVTIFPIIFSFGLEPDAGPGLVFVSLPVAFSQMPAGSLWAAMFFVLLGIAALSSTVSVFEVVVSHLIDERRLSRRQACLASAGMLFVVGLPSALSGGTQLFGAGFSAFTSVVPIVGGRNWFDFADHIASNWLLPLSGLGIALFAAWHVGGEARRQAFMSGTRFGRLYWSWVWLLRYFVPPAVLAVLVHATGLCNR